MVILPLNNLPNYSNSKKSCLASSQQIEEITNPIIEFLGGSGFALHRLYKDGHRVYLSSSPEWIEHFYDNYYMQCSSYNKFLGKKLMLWKHWPQQNDNYTKLIYSSRKNLGIDNGLIINQLNEDYIDCFELRGYINDDNINHRYLSNIDIIEKYILHFEIHTAELIKRAHQYKVIIPENVGDSTFISHQEIQQKKVQDVMRELKKFKLICGKNNIPFSKRETECIFSMLLGKTSKEIAKKMLVSPRTVEDNINSIKLKLDCSFKSQIISKVSSHPINKILIADFFLGNERAPRQEG